jgi:O-antigen/teichoic acid export membrane protein
MKETLLKTLRFTLQNNHLMSLSGNVVVSVLSLVSASLLFRAMELHETGMWFFFMSTLSFVETFRSGFIYTAFIKNYSGAEKGRAAEVLGSTWVIALAITGALILLNVLVLLLPFDLHNPGFDLFLKWFGITFLVSLPTVIATMVLQAELRFDKMLLMRFVNQGLFIVFIFALYLSDQISLQHIFFSNLTASAISGVFVLVKGWSRINLISYKTSTCVKEICHFGKYSVGTNLSSSLLVNSDTFFITFMLGPAALAVYNLAKRFMEIIDMPLRSFMATGMAALSVAFNQGNQQEVARILTKYSGLLTWAFVPVVLGLIFLADIPVSLIGGGQYVGTESANLLRIFIVLSLILPLDRFIALTTDVVNQPKINMLKTLLQLVLNVAGNFLSLSLIGNIYGVALASIPTVLTGFIFGVYCLNKHLPISIPGILRDSYLEGKFLLLHYLELAKSRKQLAASSHQAPGSSHEIPLT